MGNNGSVPENYGFKIVEIISRSPGEKAGLIVEADFILTVNGKKLRKLHPDQIKELVQSNEDKELKLKVFNSTTGQIRDVTIVPTKNWPGQGLLGVKIRLEPYGDLNVEVSIADSEFSYDDIYAQEKESNGIGASDPNKLGKSQKSKRSSFIDPLGVFKSGKR